MTQIMGRWNHWESILHTGKSVCKNLDGSKTFTWDPNDKRPVGDATAN
jgi:hypothetical protein